MTCTCEGCKRRRVLCDRCGGCGECCNCLHWPVGRDDDEQEQIDRLRWLYATHGKIQCEKARMACWRQARGLDGC